MKTSNEVREPRPTPFVGRTKALMVFCVITSVMFVAWNLVAYFDSTNEANEMSRAVIVVVFMAWVAHRALEIEQKLDWITGRLEEQQKQLDKKNRDNE